MADFKQNLSNSKIADLKETLKELYTSETTLAQKIVLTPLNNEFKGDGGVSVFGGGGAQWGDHRG